MDYGDEGLQNTLSELDYLSFSGAGFTFEEAYRPAIFHKNDMKIASEGNIEISSIVGWITLRIISASL